MKVLVVGGGGREHALAWAMARSKAVDGVYAAPGNGGTSMLAENVAVSSEDIGALVRCACEREVDLTVVGPEAPLVAGIVDRFRDAGLRCFGPTAAAARLEGSKVFAKQFMHAHGVPTADFTVHDDPNSARKAVRERGVPCVIKADGLAAGKGVIVASSEEDADSAIEQIMIERKFGRSGERIVVESFLRGEELSVHAICAGGQAALLPSSQDHKRAWDGDRGPNTGGMGAYGPVPRVDDAMRDRIYREIVSPTLAGMEEEGTPFSGVLYCGLMLTDEGPKVLEYNVRFGDPETQVLVPLVRSDLFELLYRTADGKPVERIECHDGRRAAAVVVASRGYPGGYEKGFPIGGLEDVDDERRVVFHAGTAQEGKKVVTSGGRVLAVCSWGSSLREALEHAYAGVRRIEFEGAYWRSDIGRRAL